MRPPRTLWPRWLALVVIAALLTASLPVTAFAQEEAPLPVLILPIDQANFLPGVYFDFRVEVHVEAMPEDFAVTINGIDAAEFFGAEPEAESWQFGPEDASITSQSVIWREVMLDEAGAYEVVVTAGGDETAVRWIVREPAPAAGAKNVILFLMDGGSQGVYTAARLISRGMVQGTYRSNLVFENFEETGFLHTSGMDSIITDSANSASAYNTGHKTAVNANGVYPDTSPETLDDPRTEKFAYLVSRLREMSVGIVTTAHWGDATPNGVHGYGRDRSNYSINSYVAQALDEGLMPAVILGGGGRNMIPKSVEGSRRDDERDLFSEYEDAGYTVVTTGEELGEAVRGAELPSHLLGIFHSNNMDTWLDRNVFTDNSANFPDQPGLVEMTEAALAVLGQNPNGFYLEVEAASVDKALHPMDFERALADAIEFERSVAAAVEWAAENAPDTLIVVTSDHAHSYDVYGTVDTVAFNAAADEAGKRNAIRIYADAGFPTYEDANGDFFPDSWDVSVVLAQGKVDNPFFTEDFQVSPVYRTPALVTDGKTVDNPDDDPNGLPLGGNLPDGANSSVHTLQSVPVYATGPGAGCFGHSKENTEVFFCLAEALGLNPAAEAAAASCPGIVVDGMCYVPYSE